MKKHANLSIFVPHAGCTHKCSFCDQRTISQTKTVPSAKEITEFCEKYLPKNTHDTEIAFFGGSFTAICEDVRVALLEAAYEFVKKGRAKGIRLSTRPDAIDDVILNQLKQFGVTAIELGAQSMDDKVLMLNKRGHTAQKVETAAKLIKQEGFSLGLQMMPGLYGADDYEKESLSTMARLLALAPDTMRIYPTVVIQHTELADLYYNKQYIPLSIQQAVDICAKLILMCEKTQTNIIRVGLAADAQMEKQVIAGAYHPSFRELCESKIFYDLIKNKLYTKAKGDYVIQVNPLRISVAIGNKKGNISKFFENGYNIKIVPMGNLENREFNLL